MAYPTVDKPYGLKPINLIGGQVFAGATRQMEIATTANVGYGTSIFYGDLVKRVTGGTIEKDTGTTTATPCGVFLGCTFTNSSTGQVQFQQFYPASTVHVHQELRFLLLLLMILTRCFKWFLVLEPRLLPQWALLPLARTLP
jgi:hypothetical protein